MKIKMLNDGFDNDIKIWSKDDIYEVNNSNSYYEIKEINGQKYGVSKIESGIEFIVV